jgi:hypothetical protein
MRMKRFLAGVLMVIFLGGCGGQTSSAPEEDAVTAPQEDAVKRVCGPDVEQVPCGPGVEIGRTYSFDLLTHCGIEWAYFNGHYWVPRTKVAAPSRWNPIERGKMTLTDSGKAHFEGTAPGTVDFVPAPAGYSPTPCR